MVNENDLSMIVVFWSTISHLPSHNNIENTVLVPQGLYITNNKKINKQTKNLKKKSFTHRLYLTNDKISNRNVSW